MAFKILFLVLIVLSGAPPAIAAEITFLTHSIEGKTYFDESGELRGKKHSGRRAFQLELVREMMIKLDFAPRVYQVFPFKRGITMIKENRKQYAFFNTLKRPDRLEQMKFVGPLTQSINYLYELKTAPSGIQTLEQAKKLPVCVLLGGTAEKVATNSGFTNIIRNDYEECFKMLTRKRVRFVSMSNLDLRGVLINAGINPDLIQSTTVHLYKAEGSMSFSNQVPDDVVQKWQSALDEIKQSGRYDELLTEYLYPK